MALRCRTWKTSLVVLLGHNTGWPPAEKAVCTLTSVRRVTGRSSTRCLCKKGGCVRTCMPGTGRGECESCLLALLWELPAHVRGRGIGDHRSFCSCWTTDGFRDPKWANQISYNDFSMARGETQRLGILWISWKDPCTLAAKAHRASLVPSLPES